MVDREHLEYVFHVAEETTSKKRSQSKRLRKLSHFEEYLLTLLFIRVGYDYQMLGHFFEVSRTVASNAVSMWVRILYDILNGWLIWPSAATVRECLPADYPSEFADTRIILDCTEVFTVKATNPSVQAATYSSYKHHNTLEFLVGVTPLGHITFVSRVYAGNVSDRYITEVEFLEKVEPGDAIMADRGFNIGDLLLQRGAKLYMPPFTRKMENGTRRTLNQNEIARTRKIAALQIHVERAIQRMKTFKVFAHSVDATLWPIMDYVIVIVAVLSNMMAPLKE